MKKPLSVLVFAAVLVVSACGGEPPAPVLVTVEPSPSASPSLEPEPSASPVAAPMTPGNVFEMVGVTAVATDTAPDSTDSSGNPVTYDIEHVLDGDPSTAWRVECEAEWDPEVCYNENAYILITFDQPVVLSRVGLIPGYAKVDATSGADWFELNRKIRYAQWTLSDGSTWEQTFEPEPTMQTIPVAGTVTWIRIDEINVSDAWEPNDRNFLVISDIEVVGMPAPEAS